MAWTWITLAVVVLACLLRLWLKKRTQRKLPPGPKGLPIIGHLHMLGKNPHQDFQKLAEKHGPIMSMRFGFIPNIIVSSPDAAKQFLKTHDLNFASRPSLEAAKHISYEQRNLSFSPYGPYWRNMRKLCTLELFSNLKINTFQALRKRELAELVNILEQAAQEHVAVDISTRITSLTSDISCQMVFGKKFENKEFDERGFKGVIEEGMKMAVAFNLGDYFPYIGALDLQGLTKKMKAIAKVWDQFFEKILDEHDQPKEHGQTKDFVDTMLGIMKSGESEFEFDRSHVKAILMDVFAASAETSSTTIEWTLSELLRNPRVLRKVQKELEQVVGLDKMVEESDLESLEYLNMVIKEAMRLHPVAPLLLPHLSIEDCTVDGFFIPKNSRVVINVWAIGRDSKVWTDAEKFLPERFVGSNIDLRGRDFELLPFGSGRRGCPGMQLGLTMVRLVVAQLVHYFNWDLPNGMQQSELDMTEEFGIVVGRATHLIAIPTSRFKK
ncbi:Cytochrome P450, family 71, subfamily B, polypeptide 37 [Heracleum sosnowskyi]|uniref:Cytochrome P450, family 71, subfamily B, polypeptide 37 n=1 Tax=Heracleum sosnowskyi TaxID=360622 RepID=A0AAD8HQS3_9APIA|nr:Cytochrome P450, family 71, subfamily B, polypeptide 37 [Heracleum sosnowskyi]KAK1371700.1 Cytochrome P450, family 71, subfamily B, polypeptide 37 [Heracleum sosnowskyi]